MQTNHIRPSFVKGVFYFAVFALFFINIFLDIYSLRYLHTCVYRLYPLIRSYPGEHFLGLHRYLRGVRFVGYDSDRRTKSPFTNSAFAYAYQQAQYALSPTLLDYMNYSRHRMVILRYTDRNKLIRKIDELDGKILYNLSDKIILIRREDR